MTIKTSINRRGFVSTVGASIGAVALAGCDSPPQECYNQTDIDTLAAQRATEQQTRGKGPHGTHVYQGYRGLSDLPWFALV